MPDETLPEKPWLEGEPPPGRSCWTWHPTGLGDLPGVRREFRQLMASGLDGPAPPSDDSLEDAATT